MLSIHKTILHLCWWPLTSLEIRRPIQSLSEIKYFLCFAYNPALSTTMLSCSQTSKESEGKVRSFLLKHRPAVQTFSFPPITASSKVSLPASLLHLLCQLLLDSTLFLGTIANFVTNYPQKNHMHQSGKGSVFGHTLNRLTYSFTGISAGIFAKQKKKQITCS